MELRSQRNWLNISQSKLAILSGVSRFKICVHELGGGSLTAAELGRVEQAIRAEALRLKTRLSQNGDG